MFLGFIVYSSPNLLLTNISHESSTYSFFAIKHQLTLLFNNAFQISFLRYIHHCLCFCQ